MANFDGLDKPVLVSPSGKKRKPSKNNLDREIEKKRRHAGGGKAPFMACTHSAAQNHSFCHAD